MCASCRTKRPKRELVRVVRTPLGQVEVDPTGKKSGRGAYFCRSQDCWEKGLARRRLDHVLKVALSAENREKLLEFSLSLEKGEGNLA